MGSPTLSLEPVIRALEWLNKGEVGEVGEGVLICSPEAVTLKKDIEATLKPYVDCKIVEGDELVSHFDLQYPSYKIVVLEGDCLQCIEPVRRRDPRARIVVLSDKLFKERSLVNMAIYPPCRANIGMVVRRQLEAVAEARNTTASLVSAALVSQISHNAPGIVASLPQKLQHQFSNTLTFASVETTSLWRVDLTRGVLSRPHKDNTVYQLDENWREDKETAICSTLGLESGSILIMIMDSWILILPALNETPEEIKRESGQNFTLRYQPFEYLFYFIFVS